MSNKSSDKSRMPRETYETDGDRHQPKHGGRKFVSDEDIVGQTDWLKQSRRIRQRDQKEPKFVSDDDIVDRRVA